MIAHRQGALRRNLLLATAALALASAAFWATMLTVPPTSRAAVSTPVPSRPVVTLCAYLPTGDIEHCTLHN